LAPFGAAATQGEPALERRGVLEQWMKETDDPLLRGDVPPPPGARVNDAGGISPREKPVEYD
jgi:hypothetical protein